MKLKFDDMEQYSIDDMFKFTGIKEEKEENTDNAIINIVREGGYGYRGKHFIILLRKYFIIKETLC